MAEGRNLEYFVTSSTYSSLSWLKTFVETSLLVSSMSIGSYGFLYIDRKVWVLCVYPKYQSSLSYLSQFAGSKNTNHGTIFLTRNARPNTRGLKHPLRDSVTSKFQFISTRVLIPP